MDWGNVDGLISRHMKVLKKKSKLSFPEEHFCFCDYNLNSDKVKLNWLEHGIRKKVGRLKKRSIRYPFRNLSRIKI